MSLFDSIVSQFGAPSDVGNLAAKLGLEKHTVERAIAALAKAHQEERDTLTSASAKSGIDTSTLGSIVEQIGGEGSLGEYARTLNEHPQAANLFGFLDRDGDGEVLDDIKDAAGRLFGKE